MSHLLQSPLWQADSLGSPLPDNEFGVSVSLPLWAHVIGYEEGDAAITSQFRSGYPRFFLPPAIERLFKAAEQALGRPSERCIVFPRLVHAERCLEWLRRNGISDGLRIATFTDDALGVALFPAAAYDTARKFWRFAGEVVSIRQSLHALGETSSVSREGGEQASAKIRQHLAALSGQEAEDVFLFPSGMAASFAVHRMITTLFPGRKTTQLGFPYVDVLKIQQHFGTGAHFFPVLDDQSYKQLSDLLVREPQAGIFSEAPTNPLLQCCDYEWLSSFAGESPLIIDDTIGTSVHVDAFRFADAVTTSLTKAFSGAGDVLAGSVILSRASKHYAAFSAFLREHNDHALFPADAVVLEQNSRDFEERALGSSLNSVALYHYLRQHPKVARVWHSINEGGPGYAQIQRGNGHGCLFSFVLKDEFKTPAFYDALEVCKGPSLGTDFTLVCPYTLLAHYQELDWAESCGVPRHLIRVSAGLEDSTDLIARFERALAKA
ncbi:MAG: PLP-dependent transferase [Verrucomicrobiaceae bacterium]|nr:PLP-dependent transferase [Verrucomicrobiaceae bacterium]